MANFIDANPEALAVAGGAIASALLDLLVARNLIGAGDARKVCGDAQAEIKRQIGMRGDTASAIIDEIVRRLP